MHCLSAFGKKRPSLGGLLFFFVLSCTFPGEEERSSPRTFSIGVFSFPKSLDPAADDSPLGSQFHTFFFEGIIAQHPGQKKVVKSLIDRWELSADFTSISFLLKTAYWSNGDPITAWDVANSWIQMINGSTKSKRNAITASLIQGGQAFYKGELPPEKVGITVVGERALRVDFSKPVPYFKQLFASRLFLVTPRRDAKNLPAGWADSPDSFAGNGPFVLTFRDSERIVASANPHYWNRKSRYIESISIHRVPNFLTLDNMHRNHLVDWVPLLHYIWPIEKDLHLTPNYGGLFFFLNTSLSPLDDVKVRRALALSLTKELLPIPNIPKSWREFVVTQSLINVLTSYIPLKGIESNPSRAQNLFKQSHYFGQRKTTPLTIVSSDQANKAIAEKAKLLWQEILDLSFSEILLLEDLPLQQGVKDDSKIHLISCQWKGEYEDPTALLSLFRQGGSLNFFGWRDERFEELMDEASQLPLGSERTLILRKAEKRLIRETVVVIPLYASHRFDLVDTNEWRGWANIGGWTGWRGPFSFGTFPVHWLRRSR